VTRSPSDPALADLWRFVRGDATVAVFEQWIYARSDELERRLGQEKALEVLAADYRSSEAVVRVKELLRDYLESVWTDECRCITLPKLAVIDMGEESNQALATIERRRARGEPFWWLWAGECTCCAQWWLVGQEERQNDVFCLRRLDDGEANALVEHNIWPSDFDSYEVLLRLSMEAGKSVRFVEPETAKSLRSTIEDLARARPGICVSELAELLNLDVDTAKRLARRVVHEEGVLVEFDR